MHLVFLMYALFASIFTVAKATLQYAQPFFLLGTRMVLAGIILLGYQFIFKRELLRWNARYLKPLLMVIFFTFFLTNVFEFWGLQFLSSSKTCFIYSLSPFISALLSYFIFTEKLTYKKWIGLLIGFCGMFPVFIEDSQAETGLTHLLFFSAAELALIAAVFCSCYGWISMQKLCKDDYSPLTANGFGMFFGGILALITSFIFEKWEPVPVTQWTPVIEGTIYMLIISNLLAYNMYSFLLRRFTATFMSFAGFVTPIFVSIYGRIFLGELFSPTFFISASIVFIGLYLFHQEELKLQGLEIR
ncbi:MAG: conserved putative rane protein [Chlamydiales bacterium]|jgi:drug/metabolite transporter (DMT)-like permease|nr:conserved putative rane protein [Chlamydiales bacterium]